MRSSISRFLVVSFLGAPIWTVYAQVPVERVRPNDNRARAGILGRGVLALRLEARMAEWHPMGPDAPGMTIPVFAEMGRPAQVPGPLIRVPGGTNVIAVVRNFIPNATLTIHGLHSRPAIGEQFNDSIQLAPGQVQQVRFRLDRPGTYYYWGTTTGRDFRNRTREDAQLTGVIVVDEPGQRAPKDRILVIGMSADTAGSEAARDRRRQLFAINGESWPHTAKLAYEKGELVRWRVVNASADAHPMHLHGFFFRVLRRGDGKADTVYGERGDLVNTETMVPGATMSVAWVADRLGNWLFHCHIPDHFMPRDALGFASQAILQAGTGHSDHANPGTAMGGLVTGIEITPQEDDTTTVVPIPVIEPARYLRLVMQPNAGSTRSAPLYGLSLQEGDAIGAEPATQVGQTVGPPIVLNRGEPVSITLVNRLPEATSIHWHGMELDSYYDGVPGISGIKPELAPAIAPLDSLEVRFNPPRAGTFIYHAHTNEKRQHSAGIVGPLLVVDKDKHDGSREINVLVSSPSDSAAELRSVLINGRLQPDSIELRRGASYRLRLINITTARPGLRVELTLDTAHVNWRTVAKDGAEAPQSARTLRPAIQSLSIGETMDVEFFATRSGEYRLEAKTGSGIPLGTLVLRVR